MVKSVVVALDPGPETSGMAVIEAGRIVRAANVANRVLLNIILCLGPKDSLQVLIEDMKAYDGRLSQDLIDTCKWIGELTYRLKQAKIAVELIPRSTVKWWIFRTFPEISIPRIEREIIRRDLRRDNGELCKPSGVYVKDPIVIAAMKEKWSIPTPKPGQTNRYGLKTHSWQALALASYYLSTIHEEVQASRACCQ